ncbi:MAG: biotin transporter BioY [Selenomonadaceae bacterium]|nr:biotin transporter BioY [Selenomonadaceae bacterium]
MKRLTVRDMTKISMCVALCCVTAYISFPLPFTPGMITALTFAMSLTAYILPPRQTFTVILVYILLGSVGLPVFVGGTSGIGRLFLPTGGFIWAWLIAYPLLSYLKGSTPNLKRYMLANIATVLPITYAGGLISMVLLMEITLWQAMTMAVFPYIFGDTLKALAAALLGIKLQKYLGER